MRVEEGTTAFVDYEMRDEDGELISVVNLLEYKVTSGLGTTLVNWTSVAGATAFGRLTISATTNTRASSRDNYRFITIRCTYDAIKKCTKEIDYELSDIKGI